MKGLMDKIIVFAIIVISTILIVNNVTPLVEEGQNLQRITDAKQILKVVDTVANQLSVESTGAQRAISINLPENSRLIFSGTEDKIKINLGGIDVFKIAGRIEEENIVIEGGGTLDAYESDIDSDGDTDLVIENPAVLFAVQKLGNQDNHIFVNTTNFITLIKNKRQNINMVPRSGIFINENSTSSYGFGYTMLSPTRTAQSASILLRLNSTANITYDALFTLSAGMDFVEMEVRNVKGV